ncbi:hypothetical protein TIFTF001_009275 [Ficus carica]|uniref:Non-haem dioxygenase N-terminal domain-containing protein n=1 Tax=Ficus carica TaxID=3494 RepID=A0AA87ZUC6_FICCA|nr:hypothetical protein TIFTF001_009275 [Ficus carica]
MDSSQGKDFPQIFDSSFLQEQTHFPTGFIWPDEDLPSNGTIGVLNEPLVDLEGFLNGDEAATMRAAELIREACTSHGFFQVMNHGVDSSLISLAHEHLESFFNLPATEKIRAPKTPGRIIGYSAAHSEHFAAKLPWKETLTFFHETGRASDVPVVKTTSPPLLARIVRRKGEVVLDNGNVRGTAGFMEERDRLLPRQLRSEAFGVRRGVAGDTTGGLRRPNLLGSWELEESLEVFMSEVDEA